MRAGVLARNGCKFKSSNGSRKAVKMKTEASRFEFIMNSFGAPNFNTVLFLQSPLRHPRELCLPLTTSEIICDGGARHVCLRYLVDISRNILTAVTVHEQF